MRRPMFLTSEKDEKPRRLMGYQRIARGMYRARRGPIRKAIWERFIGEGMEHVETRVTAGTSLVKIERVYRKKHDKTPGDAEQTE